MTKQSKSAMKFATAFLVVVLGFGATGCGGTDDGSEPGAGSDEVITVEPEFAAPGGSKAVQFFAVPLVDVALGSFKGVGPNGRNSVRKDFEGEEFAEGDRIPLQPNAIWHERFPGDWVFSFDGTAAGKAFSKEVTVTVEL